MGDKYIGLAEDILNALRERKGIGDELDMVDDDIWDEIIDEIAEIIEKGIGL